MKKISVLCIILSIFLLNIYVYASNTNDETLIFNNEQIIEKEVPLLGKINVKEVSIPLIAVVLGLVDGFNPCAMWILVFLITLLFTLKDKKKMWTLGLIFIFTSAIVYSLFMFSWLKLTDFLHKFAFIKLLIAIFAIIFGMISIYRYFINKNKSVGCDVTNQKQRLDIMDKIRQIISKKSFLLSIIGIILLAAVVNIIELFCSLGLPTTFVGILSINELTKTQNFIYILIYIIFFMLDDIIIFTLAMISLKIKGLSSKYTKYSHLVGGLIMIIIGLLLVLKPEWLMFNF